MAGSKGMLVWNSDDDERWGEIDGMDDLGEDESEEEINNDDDDDDDEEDESDEGIESEEEEVNDEIVDRL
jgi:hypothetical protein